MYFPSKSYLFSLASVTHGFEYLDVVKDDIGLVDVENRCLCLQMGWGDSFYIGREHARKKVIAASQQVAMIIREW